MPSTAMTVLQAEREGIDELIAASATNWTIARMGVIDRNILRLAAYELVYFVHGSGGPLHPDEAMAT